MGQAIAPRIGMRSLSLLNLTYIAILMLPISATGDINLPYRKCDLKKDEYTKSVLGNFSSAFGVFNNNDITETLCDYENQHKVKLDIEVDDILEELPKDQGTDIPPICFFAAAMRGQNIQKSSHYCPDGQHGERGDQTSNKDSPMSFCINKKYVEMTSRSFNKMASCFNFSPTDKKYIFRLLNHESGFILNNKSRTGAVCYGQMTKVAIKDVNWRLARGLYVYKNFVEKCPEVDMERIVIPKELLPRGKKKEMKEAVDITQKNIGRIRCFLTHNPESCFFYSMAAIKQNSNYMEGKLYDTPNYNPNIKNTDPKIHDALKMPIRLGELVYVEGICVKNGKSIDLKAGLVFQDSATLYEDLSGCENLESTLKIKKVKVFKGIDSSIKYDVLLSAYNAGATVINLFQSYIKDFKNKIVYAGSACSDSNPYCKHRKKIAMGEPIDDTVFLKEFRDQLKEEYPDNKEVVPFAKKVREDIQYISAPKWIKSRDLVKGHAFENSVKENCLTKLHL